MTQYVIGLGSNLGDRLGHLCRARDEIARRCGSIVATSRVFESPPLGPPQPHYLNAAVRVHCELDAQPLLATLLAIERDMGRIRRERWGPRIIDLDILWSPHVAVDDAQLSVPHAELRSRTFALAPLIDVAPDAEQDYRDALTVLGGPPAIVLDTLPHSARTEHT